jgi:hypothetical protein
MTRPTLADVRRMMLHGDTALRSRDLRLAWESKPRLVTYPTGVRGYLARVRVTHPGYRPSVLVVNRDEQGTGIR